MLNNKIKELFSPIIFIDGIKSALILPKSITIDRDENIKIDNYLFIEQIICEYLYFLINKYGTLDLRKEENIFKLNDKNDNSSFLIKSRINLFIQDKLVNTLKSHGGNLIIHEVDILNKIIIFQLIGSCMNCIFKKNIIDSLHKFIQKEIGDFKLKYKNYST